MAAQWWTALHGFVMAELSRFIDVVDDAEDTVLWPLMDHLLSSLIRTPEPARKDAWRWASDQQVSKARPDATWSTRARRARRGADRQASRPRTGRFDVPEADGLQDERSLVAKLVQDDDPLR